MNLLERKLITKIERIRKFKGWNQEDFASKINYTVGAWRNIVYGNRSLSLATLEKVACVFGCEAIDLFD